MKLTALLDTLYLKTIHGSVEHIEIEHIAQDSRKVRPNTLFFCVEGVTVDGHQFAQKALELGAVAFVASKNIDDAVQGAPVIYVDDVTRVMALLANHFYDYPSTKMNLIGVTGTNGKTTVTHMIDYLMSQSDKPTALVGTIYRKIGSKHIQTHNTTPEILTVHETLQELQHIGGDTCIMEVSSHALQLGRVWGMDYQVAVFTNLSHEHLDLHKTMANYAHAKSLLFSQMGQNHGHTKRPKVGILNADDAYYEEFRYATGVEILSYGIEKDADFRASNIHMEQGKTTFQLTVRRQKTYEVVVPLIGVFNVYNVLAAVAVAFVQGIPLEVAIDKMRYFTGVPGRMQSVNKGQDFQVVVDFAHTPDGLEKVLTSLQAVSHQRIITVMGHSGGNRDSSMRPELGKIATDLSDVVIFTADNPRNEPLSQIYEGLLQEVTTQNYTCIDDRPSAILHAIQEAKTGDIVLLAGKGVEPYQIIGDVEYPYDEISEVEKALFKRTEEKGE